MRCGEVKPFLQEIIFYIHNQSCNSLLMFALFINNNNFEVNGLILESKLLLKLFFVRKTYEVIPLPLILRTKRRLFSTVTAGGFQCLHQNGKTGNSSMHENVVCLQVWFMAILVFQRINCLHNMNEINPKTRRLFWFWRNTATLIHIRSRSYIFPRAEWT